jgi:L-lactate dehydrogenase (cytochrome)
MYAAAIAEEPGVRHGINLLKVEIDRDMALLGINAIAELAPGLLLDLPGSRGKRGGHPS